jgi:hypothetical protein
LNIDFGGEYSKAFSGINFYGKTILLQWHKRQGSPCQIQIILLSAYAPSYFVVVGKTICQHRPKQGRHVFFGSKKKSLFVLQQRQKRAVDHFLLIHLDAAEHSVHPRVDA